MSQQLIAHSDDLLRLRNEGYDIEVLNGTILVMRDVPYVDASKTVKRGVLVDPALHLAGEKASTVDDHVMKFVGDHPCNADGSKLERIQHQSERTEYAKGLFFDHSFSAKAQGDTGPRPYRDYFEKFVTYANILGDQARVLDPAADARTFPVVLDLADGSPFRYADTASSRAQIDLATERLRGHVLGIIGLGGTGSYILDLVSKTPAKEIHLFDGDVFSQHNAFRAPGAPTKERLQSCPTKVAHFAEIYGAMHAGIIPHEGLLGEFGLEILDSLDFIFVAMDGGPAKRHVVERLELSGKPFIDVGMGIQRNEDSLSGILRVTTSSTEKRDHFRSRVGLASTDEPNEYSKNIQVADLNALNAALAVIRWKKFLGFYQDHEGEFSSTYTIGTNLLLSEERASNEEA